MLDFRRIEDVEFSDGETEAEDNFEPREQELKSDEIDFILDGQQRITSIYKLFPAALVPTDYSYEPELKFRHAVLQGFSLSLVYQTERQ